MSDGLDESDEDELRRIDMIAAAAERVGACLKGGTIDNAGDGFALGAEWGAGWAFAIVGMAQAIRDTDLWRRREADSFITPNGTRLYLRR